MNSADFDSIAKSLAYESDLAMFQDFYIVRKMSFQRISDIIGYSSGTVRARIKQLEIPTRGKGGPNRLGMSKLVSIPDEEIILVSVCARKYNLSKSAVWHEKRRRNLGANKSGSSSEVQGGELLLQCDPTESSGAPRGDEPRRVEDELRRGGGEGDLNQLDDSLRNPPSD